MNKDEIILSIKNEVQKVIDGDSNPLDALIIIKGLETAIKSARESILDDCLTEFDKHGEKAVKYHGCQFSATQSGRYDFSHNKDWSDLSSKMKSIESKMKIAYSNPGTALIDEDTGEVYEPASYKSSKRSISVKMLK